MCRGIFHENEAIVRPHAGRSVWAFVSFLALFCLVLGLLTELYLPQALTAFKAADERGRRLLAVHALLLMCAVLAILALSWMMIFRVGRYFFPPRGGTKEAKTEYTDAWTEAGKRMRPPEE